MTYIRKNSYVILFFILILTLSFYTAFSHNNDQAHIIQLKIEQGDTLWSLANEYSGNMPQHEWIDEIMQENKLSAPTITAGQTLKIPKVQMEFAPDGNIKLASDAE